MSEGPGRVVGLDYGEARCGVAVTDPTWTVVRPLDPVLRPGTRKGLRRVVEAVAAHAPARVVVGLPLSLGGSDSAQTTETRAWAARLAALVAAPVELADERFTTKLAARRGGAGSEDSRAAAILLEGWLAAAATRAAGRPPAAPPGDLPR